MNESVGILCRGQSMVLAEKYFKDIEDIIIVNTFFEELEKPFVQKILKNKNITHICCREPSSILNKKLYDKFQIKNIVLNVYEPEFKTRSVVKRILDGQGVESKPLPDLMKNFEKDDGGFPTTGVLSVVYASKFLKKKNIYVAGMDFYRSPYLANKKVRPVQIKKGGWMIDYIKKFIKDNQENNFTFLSNLDLELNLKNYHYINK